MPAGQVAHKTAKSFWPYLVGFLVASGVYTTTVARGEAMVIDNARARWQRQKAANDAAITEYGKQMLEKKL
ncbi:hypothetical protein AOQ84DRAFT_226024 [Glonium stellatum]|uniref:Uncharacterized protein n=1 Tax=Glonium stellatum TaxID=574774 RepID=A0A8E2FDF8_9PEZI|nr:hypothetical protein AOQ84DRAFT_226024 [Glonium stellatum]